MNANKDYQENVAIVWKNIYVFIDSYLFINQPFLLKLVMVRELTTL